MRNVFNQYTQPENQLTHALACALAEDDRLLRRFVRWATGKAAPASRLRIVEQQRPGEESGPEEGARGIPDAWIFNDEGWALLVESKIAAPLSAAQLRRHRATAIRRGFGEPLLLALTAGGRIPRLESHVQCRKWTDLYQWLRQQGSRSSWAARCSAYMEILEADLIERGYLREGAMTTFSGIPFGPDEPYNYLEAKRLLKLALAELRGSVRLERELGIDLSAPGRGAITGREQSSVWDFLRLHTAAHASVFTKFPHFTLAIESDRALAIVTVPHGIQSQFRRRLVELGQEGFKGLFRMIDSKLRIALKGDKGAVPIVIVVQRRYPTQRSAAIVDAKIEFDLRTAIPTTGRDAKSRVKVQPQWLDATFQAISKKSSNLQVAIGAAFPFGRSSSVRDKDFTQRVSDAWLACEPLLIAMGAASRRKKPLKRSRRAS